MNDLGKLSHFLGIDVQRDADCVKMSQRRYVEKILERFDTKHYKFRVMPCKEKLNYTDDAELMGDVREYREVVCCLIYLSTCTRPDLSFFVSKLSQHFASPTVEQWKTAKPVLRYLKNF